jgi:outer membrane protein, adhesin transport system
MSLVTDVTKGLAGALLYTTLGFYSAHASSVIGVSELTQSTLAQHPSLRASAARTAAAEVGVDAAKWQFWPTPRLSIEHANSTSGTGEGAGRTLGVLRIEQPLWTGGRLSAGVERAESAVLVTQAETQEARQALALRLIQSWSDLMGAQRKLHAQHVSLARHENLLQMVERRIANGVSAESDASLARSRIEVVQSDILLLEAQRDAALDRLRLLSGQRLTTAQLAGSHDLPDMLQRTLAELVAQALDASPQLLKSRYSLEVARAEVKTAQSSLMPELALRYEHQQGRSTPLAPSSSNRLLISLNSSLGAGLSGWAGIDAATARLQAAHEDIELQTQSVIEQVQSDFTLAKATYARLRGLKSAANASADVLESYERQFLAGRKQWLDLMNAAREQALSDSQLVDAFIALELSTLRLVLWTGGIDALLQVRPKALDQRLPR